MVSADGSSVRELTDHIAGTAAPIWPTRWTDGEDCEVPPRPDGGWDYEWGDISPVWSPDGKQIIFFSDRDCDSEIFIMNADGSGGRQLTYNDGHDMWPSWTR